MLITRTSMVTNKVHTIELPITDEQIAAYKSGKLAQQAFPHLTAGQREFFITGITEEEWNEVFSDDDDEPFLDDGGEEPAF